MEYTEDTNSDEEGIEQIEVTRAPTIRRSNREGAGQGVERLEMSLGNDREYASIRNKNYQFVMLNDRHPTRKEGKSFMNVAANHLFAQVSEHTQMSAKAGIKKFGDQAVAAMISEYKQLNAGPAPGKPVFGCINYFSL